MEKHLWKNVHDLPSVRKRAVQAAKMLKIVADDADSTAYEKQAAAAGIVCIREITSRLENRTASWNSSVRTCTSVSGKKKH